MQFLLLIIKLIYQFKIPLRWSKNIQKIIDFIDEVSFKLPSSIQHEKKILNNISLEVFSPKDIPHERTIFYIHGGAFLLGINRFYRRFAAKLSIEMKADVWLVDYPLLPDNEFPSALNVCYQAYVKLVENIGKSESLILMGDSAGGNLAVACLYLAKESKTSLPQGVVLFSPWLDLTLSGKSLEEYRDCDPVVMPSLMPEIIDLYLKGKVSSDHYLVSPLHGNLEGFPPLFVSVGNYEVLQDDGLRFAHKARREGACKVTIEIGEKMPHVYPILFPAHPQSVKCWQALKDFLHRTHGNGI